MPIRSPSQSTLPVSRARGLAIAAAGLALLAGAAILAGRATAATPVQKVVSPGGIEAWLMESHDAGLISMKFSFEGGALEEPKDKPGLAYFTGYLFNEGAGDMDTAEFTRRRQRIVADIYGQAGMNNITVSLQAPSVHRAEAFDLLEAALKRPRFDAEPFARARNEAEATVTAAQKAPGSIAVDLIGRKLYGDTRHAVAIEGTLASLQAITAEDVAAFRQRLLARGNLKVAVAGDIGAAELAPLLDRLFSHLPAKADLAPKPAMPEVAKSGDLVRMDLPQTIVVFANRLPRMSWRQGIAGGIANQILSDSFTGRLFMEVREKRGLVYTISTSRSDQDDMSVFMGSFGASQGNVGPALETTRTVLSSFAADGPTEDEVRAAKDAFIGGYLLGLDTSDSLSSVLLFMQRNTLPINLLEGIEAEIESITRAEVHEAAKLMIGSETMSTVAIGNPPEGFKVEAAAR